MSIINQQDPIKPVEYMDGIIIETINDNNDSDNISNIIANEINK